LYVLRAAERLLDDKKLQNFPKSHTYDALHPFIGDKSMVCSKGAVWAKQVLIS
jgi:hypothetical protein